MLTVISNNKNPMIFIFTLLEISKLNAFGPFGNFIKDPPQKALN
jgi:hypothetical protein